MVVQAGMINVKCQNGMEKVLSVIEQFLRKKCTPSGSKVSKQRILTAYCTYTVHIPSAMFSTAKLLTTKRQKIGYNKAKNVKSVNKFLNFIR
jgi:hypothetical protein